MDINRLTRDADDLIRKVVSRYNQLYVPTGKISQVELDLILDDLRKLYDTFKTIGQVNLTLQNNIPKPEVSVISGIQAETQSATEHIPAEAEKPTYTPTPPQETVFQQPEPKPEPEPIIETQPEPTPEPVFTDEKEFEYMPKPVSENKPEPESQVQSEPPASRFEPTIEEKPETPVPPSTHEPVHSTLADKFSTGNKSLSETMASSQFNGALGSRVNFQPLSDLTTGIGLNDKFSFISELFGNSASQYEEAIVRINKAVNLVEANWILQKYAIPEWDHQHESLERLKDFIKRRFV